MQDIYLSLNNNIIRLSTIGKEGLKTYSMALDPDTVSDTKILNIESFVKEVTTGLSQITPLQNSKLLLNIVVEPEDSFLRFITVNKRDGNTQDQLIADIKKKITDAELDDMYFSYQKIAPFLYQFVGVKKEFMEAHLEIANKLGVSLKSVVPWISLLPKYLNTNDPAVFICRVDGSYAVALSELGGIFYSDVNDKQISKPELQKFVSDLSLYKRNSPIKKIFTLNYGEFSVNGFETYDIRLPENLTDFPEDFKVNLLTNYVLDSDSAILGTQLNMLNLLPTPVVQKQSMKLVPAIVTAALLIGLGGLSYFLFFTDHKGFGSDKLAQNPESESVLSEMSSNQTPESTPSVPEVKPELKQADLKIMIWNGSGITGLASRTQSLLEGKRYVVTGIGNSDEDNKEATVFRFKKDKSGYVDLLKGDTSAVFPNVKIEETLEDSAQYDVLIIAGTSAKL